MLTDVWGRLMHMLTARGMFAVGIVYNAERLNGLLHQHWEKFARQPYFDAHGVFTSTFLSAPLLLDMLIILVRGCALLLPALHSLL